MFDTKNYVMKIILKSPSHHIVIKIKPNKKNLYIHKFFLHFSVFPCTSHQPISMVYLG